MFLTLTESQTGILFIANVDHIIRVLPNDTDPEKSVVYMTSITSKASAWCMILVDESIEKIIEFLNL